MEGSEEESFTATTELFDTVSNTWMPGPTMNRQRAIDVHLLLVSSEGQGNESVYAVGGTRIDLSSFSIIQLCL